MGYIRLEEAREGARENRTEDRIGSQSNRRAQRVRVPEYGSTQGFEMTRRKAVKQRANTHTYTHTYTSTRRAGSTIQTGGDGGGMAVAVMMGREEESGGKMMEAAVGGE